MSDPTPAVIRGARAADKHLDAHEWTNTGPLPPLVREILEAALDDPDLASQISTWRRPCGHSRLVYMRGELAGSNVIEFEDGCSPCVRDRMRAYFLGEQPELTDDTTEER